MQEAASYYFPEEIPLGNIGFRHFSTDACIERAKFDNILVASEDKTIYSYDFGGSNVGFSGGSYIELKDGWLQVGTQDGSGGEQIYIQADSFGVPSFSKAFSLTKEVVSAVIYQGVADESDAAYGKINTIRTSENGIFTLEAGETAVVDFGQNFAGWEKFKVSGKVGTKVTVRHGEMLNDKNGLKSRGNDGPEGSIYQTSLRSALAQTNYILKGEGVEEYHPAFTYYGFRYIQITADAPVSFHGICGEVVTSVTEDTGFIQTSNDDINQLISNIRWGNIPII